MSSTAVSQPKIFIISGGVGSSAEQLVDTVLAQFPDAQVEVRIIGTARQTRIILETLSEAKREAGLVVHTLVEESLRLLLLAEARQMGVETIDLTGPLINWLTQQLGQQPVGRPGLYRQLHRQYYERVSAIDYTLAHDDGKNREGWKDADVMLIGVSRVGKTPLSIYLAVLGWKVANYPIVPRIPIPESMFQLNHQRVFGLTIDLANLLHYRVQRQRGLGVSGQSDYVDPWEIENELREARKVFKQHGFHILDMTGKTIEQGADEIQKHVLPRQ